jgi:hypothetical protein
MGYNGSSVNGIILGHGKIIIKENMTVYDGRFKNSQSQTPAPSNFSKQASLTRASGVMISQAEMVRGTEQMEIDGRER